MVSDKPALKKSPYSKSELEEFKEMLLEKRKSLVGDMNGMESEALRTSRQDAGGDLSIMPDHPANIATDNFEQEFTLGLLESERTLLTEINDALERIDNGTFGICMGTGQAIGKPRLKARPWAKFCIEYARLVEKGHIRPGEEKVEMPSTDEEPAEEAEEEEVVEEDIPEPEE
jgi:DnaK suppressor protein